jgi:hypothetical protein
MSTPDPTSTPSEGTRQAECPYVTGTVTRYCTLTPFTLTDAEREAILYCVSCAQDYRDTLDAGAERATQMIAIAMRVAMPHVGPAPAEGQRAASVTDVGGAGPTLTDAEREAIEAGIAACEDITYGGASDQEAADVLRGLLDRTDRT